MITNVLVLCADPPDAGGLGGVQVVTADLLRSAPAGARVRVAYPRHGALWVETVSPRRRTLAILDVRIDDDPLSAQSDLGDALDAALRGTRADLLHVQSANLAPYAVLAATRSSGVPFGLALHDHSLVCENYQLLLSGQRYCGIPSDLSTCDGCLAATRHRHAGRITSWRRAMAELVEACAFAIAPSESVLEHALRIHPALSDRARVLPWGIPSTGRYGEASLDARAPLRVAVVGFHAEAKGSRRLAPLLAACAHLPVEFHLFGATEGASLREVRRASAKVVVHGAYPRDKLGRRLARARCDVVLLPSVMPEAFSLVLSEVLAAGYPVIGSNLGALAERIRKDDSGWVFDPWEPRSLAVLLSELARDRQQVLRTRARVARLPVKTCEEMAREHARLWEEIARARAVHADASSEPGALARWNAGASRAGSYRVSPLAAAWGRVRASDWYRDLPLRRLLSDRTRRRVEELVSRAVRR